VILDESHRIKGGEERRRGIALLGISTIPVRKDILSGTPAPNQQRDLGPQIEFLFPGLPYSRQVESAASPRDVLRRLFVRTTKSELGLLPPNIEYPPIAMGQEQLALYSLLKDIAVQRILETRRPGSMAEIRAQRCVMYFLESSVNPVATVESLTNNADVLDITPSVNALFEAVRRAGDSNKVLESCRRTRRLVENGKKVVIWTIFKKTLFRLEQLLADLNPVSLHGDVRTGKNTDPDTREGRLRRFLGKGGESEATKSHVLIANPAAASEGISLHTVCHDAIYVDRSYNAAHYLQSLERINRIGLPPGQETNVTILESVAPAGVGSIDYSVRRRLSAKIRNMQTLLDDPDLGVLADLEDDADMPVDATIDLADLADLLEELTVRRAPPSDTQ
jgi:SNF2 family DNA or RNA helicase